MESKPCELLLKPFCQIRQSKHDVASLAAAGRRRRPMEANAQGDGETVLLGPSNHGAIRHKPVNTSSLSFTARATSTSRLVEATFLRASPHAPASRCGPTPDPHRVSEGLRLRHDLQASRFGRAFSVAAEIKSESTTLDPIS